MTTGTTYVYRLARQFETLFEAARSPRSAAWIRTEALRRFRELSPPPSARVHYDDLVGLLAQNPPAELPDRERVQRSVDLAKAGMALLEALDGVEASEAHDGAQIAALLRARVDESRANRVQGSIEWERTVRLVRSICPPASLAELHAELVELVEALAQAWNGVSAAVEERDVEARLAAEQHYQQVADRFAELWGQIADKAADANGREMA